MSVSKKHLLLVLLSSTPFFAHSQVLPGISTSSTSYLYKLSDPSAITTNFGDTMTNGAVSVANCSPQSIYCNPHTESTCAGIGSSRGAYDASFIIVQPNVNAVRFMIAQATPTCYDTNYVGAHYEVHITANLDVAPGQSYNCISNEDAYYGSNYIIIGYSVPNNFKGNLVPIQIECDVPIKQIWTSNYSSGVANRPFYQSFEIFWGPVSPIPTSSIGLGKVANELRESNAMACGSIVHVDNQVVGESILLAGIDKFKLNYFSHYNKRLGDYKLNLPLTGANAASDTNAFDVTVTSTDGSYSSNLNITNQSNLVFTFDWDGKNKSNVVEIGPRRFTVTAKQYLSTSAVPFVKTQDIALGSFNAQKIGLNGFVPSIYQFYSDAAKTLFSGDGQIRKVQGKVVSGMTGIAHSVAETDGSLVYYFDSMGRIVFTKLGLTGTTVFTFNYDAQGNLISIVEPFNLTTQFKRLNGKLDYIVAPRGFQDVSPKGWDIGAFATKFNYDGNDKLSSTYTLHNGGTQSGYGFTFNGQNLLATFADSRGLLNTFTYDTNGNLIKDAKPTGFFFDLIKTVNSSTNYEIARVTGMNRSTLYKIEDLASGKTKQTVTTPNGVSSVRSFDSSQEIFESSGSILTTDFMQDPRFPESRYPASTVLELPNGINISSMSTQSVTLGNINDPYSITAMTATDTVGALTKTTTYNPTTKTFTSVPTGGPTVEVKIDAYQRVVSEKIGNLLPTTYTYNNDLMTGIWQGQRGYTFTYNSFGELETVSDSEYSNIYTLYYDIYGRLSGMLDNNGHQVRYSYDSAGNNTKVSIGNYSATDRIHDFSFDINDLINSYSTPYVDVNGTFLRNTTSYVYNADKQLTQIQKPSGRTVTYTYGLLTGVLTKITTSAGEYIYSHNANGLVSSITTPVGLSTEISYTGNAPVQFTYKDHVGNLIGAYSYVLAPLNGLTQQDQVVVGGTTSQLTYGYDSGLRLSSIGGANLTYDSNGQSSGSIVDNVTEEIARNSYGDVSQILVKHNGVTIYKESFDIELTRGLIVGRLQNLDGVQDTEIYQYDTNRRLKRSSNTTDTVPSVTKINTYEYDLFGNGIVVNNARMTATINNKDIIYSYSNDERLDYMTIDDTLNNQTYSAQFTYKRDGELEKRTDYNVSSWPYVLLGTTEYLYDDFGNLIKVILANGNIIEYEIDSFNRRTGKKINGVLQKRWIYQDQFRIAAELDASGNLVKRFVYGLKTNVPEYMIMGTTKYKIVTNRQGSLRAVVNAVDGTFLQKMDHDEFGNVRLDTNPGLVPFGFAGGLYDADTKLVRFGARDFDPETGRWTSKDPIMFGGGDSNLYGYTLNNPISFTDPNGLKIYDPQGLIPNWIKATEFYKKLDGNIRPIFITSGSLDGGSYGRTYSASFGIYQNVIFDIKAHDGSASNYCNNLSDYEDTVLHELYHASQNLKRFRTGGDVIENTDMVNIPGFIRAMGKYKK